MSTDYSNFLPLTVEKALAHADGPDADDPEILLAKRVRDLERELSERDAAIDKACNILGIRHPSFGSRPRHEQLLSWLPEFMDVGNKLGREVRGLRQQNTSWQPIETAPKDGTKILAVDSSGDIAAVKWDTVSMSSCNDKGWQISCVATDWNYYESMDSPTHWMPLPQPPDKPAA